MIRALSWHAWRLMTFRHDLRGLRPSGMELMVFAGALAFAASWLRFDLLHAAITVAFVVVLAGLCGLTITVALCLISVAADLLAVSLDVGGLPVPSKALDLWQFLAIVIAYLRDGARTGEMWR